MEALFFVLRCSFGIKIVVEVMIITIKMMVRITIITIIIVMTRTDTDNKDNNMYINNNITTDYKNSKKKV